MMNSLRMNALAAACTLACLGTAQAAQVAGDINFIGFSVTVRDAANNAVSDFNNGRRLDFSPNSLAFLTVTATGDIAAAFPAVGPLTGYGSIKDINYVGFLPPVNDLFVIETLLNGNELRFDLLGVSSAVVGSAAPAAQSLTVIGNGTLRLTGYDPTPGSWSFTTQRSEGGSTSRLSWSANVAAVPAPGALALLGAGFVAAAAARRRYSA